MILLDTHIWIWWVHNSPELRPWMRRTIVDQEQKGLGVSAISCWEVANLSSRGRLDLGRPVGDWMSVALSYPGIQLLDLSPAIAIESNHLPGEFHKDPADRIIVATARILDCELMTVDGKILAYGEVRVVSEVGC